MGKINENHSQVWQSCSDLHQKLIHGKKVYKRKRQQHNNKLSNHIQLTKTTFPFLYTNIFNELLRQDMKTKKPANNMVHIIILFK